MKDIKRADKITRHITFKSLPVVISANVVIPILHEVFFKSFEKHAKILTENIRTALTDTLKYFVSLKWLLICVSR